MTDRTGYRCLDAREIVRRGDKNAESADGPMMDVGAVGFKAGEVPELHFFRRVMGRPAKGAPNMVSVTFRMPKELRDAIDAKALAQGQTRGELGRLVWEREVAGEDSRTLREGEIAVRVDVLNAFRISLADIQEMIELLKKNDPANRAKHDQGWRETNSRQSVRDDPCPRNAST